MLKARSAFYSTDFKTGNCVGSFVYSAAEFAGLFFAPVPEGFFGDIKNKRPKRSVATTATNIA